MKTGSVAARAVALAHEAARMRKSVAVMAYKNAARPGYATGGGGHNGPNPMLSAQVADQGAEDEPHLGGGLIGSSGPGRTDIHNASVPAGSYILPADVISGLGEGNTMAGARIWDQILQSGPYGIPLGHTPRGGLGIQHPPAPFQEQHSPVSFTPPKFTLAAGGVARGQPWVPVKLAGGEVHVMPQDVARIGGGDIDRGMQILDEFVKHVRKKTVKTLRHLPGPVQ